MNDVEKELKGEIVVDEGNSNCINYVMCTVPNKFENYSKSLGHTGNPSFQTPKTCSCPAERRFPNERLDLSEEIHELTWACIRILRKRNFQYCQGMMRCLGVAGQTRNCRTAHRINRLLAGKSRGACDRHRVVHLCAQVYEWQVCVMLSGAEGGWWMVRVKVDPHQEILFRDRPVPFAREGAQPWPLGESDLREMKRAVGVMRLGEDLAAVRAFESAYSPGELPASRLGFIFCELPNTLCEFRLLQCL